MSATGAANLGAGTHTFAMNYTVAGSLTATGTFVFDSTNTATGITVAPFPSIQIAKSGAAPLIVGSDWTVNGNLDAHLRRAQRLGGSGIRGLGVG